MEDEKIIRLFWERNEKAIEKTADKYGGLCKWIAGNILASKEDVEECVNDTYLGIWNAIPEARPQRLSVFIGRITRNLALKKYQYLSAAKRNTEAVCSIDELGDVVSGAASVENELENMRVQKALSDFLWAQDEEKRIIFVRRYWYFDSINDICRYTGYSQSKVKSALFGMRKKLKKYLESEGIEV